MKNLLTRAIIPLIILAAGISLQCKQKTGRSLESLKNNKQVYTLCNSFEEVISISGAIYPEVIRVTDPGTKEKPMYHGFFFYNCSPTDGLHFDPTGRYIIAMRIFIEGREVCPDDSGEIGIINLEDNFKWTTVGQTTAWNWQQGCRLQWIPGSESEFIWDDRSDAGNSFVSRIYNMETGETRILPYPVYTVSPDGTTALTHDFERMKHGGTNFVGIEDKFKDQWAPEVTGIRKMNLATGESEIILSVRQMADIIYKNGFPADTAGGCLYIFREGYNVSGNRFIAFVKDVRSKTTTLGFSMTPDGKDIRFLYAEPSHHYWIDDEILLDWGRHTLPGNTEPLPDYYQFRDDGSGVPKEMLWKASNGHDSFHPSGQWILTDTYNLDGYEYMYLYHIPSKKFIPLGKFSYMLNGEHFRKNPGIFRVDLHPRFSPDGKTISFDSTHEGLGRQIYLMDISHIVDNPP